MFSWGGVGGGGGGGERTCLAYTRDKLMEVLIITQNVEDAFR